MIVIKFVTDIMRIAIVSDIHEDYHKLLKALSLLKDSGYDMLVCLGDIAGYNAQYYQHTPDADKCIELIREQADIVVIGNNDLDERRVDDNGRYHINDDNYHYLKQLPDFKIVDLDCERVLFSHFFLSDKQQIERKFPAILAAIKSHFKFLKKENCRISFLGHWHTPIPMVMRHYYWMSPLKGQRKLKEQHKVVMCPALVSGISKSTCLIWDTISHEMEQIIVG